MAYAEVCGHCNGTFSRDQGLVIWEGHSYHQKCHKCYVCSETDLRNAELFKGVIFCNSCSKRIFSSCSFAKKTRRPNMRSKYRRFERQKRRSDEKFGRHLENDLDDIKFLKRRNQESSSNSSLLQVDKSIEKKDSQVKKASTEIGVITEVTQELIERIEPVIVNNTCRTDVEHSGDTKEKVHKNSECHDLRIAELGDSTEVANMPLKKSEVQILVQKQDITTFEKNRKAFESGSSLDQEDTESSDFCQCHRTTEASDEQNHSITMEQKIGKIVKYPFKCFRRSVLERSSYINVLLNEKREQKYVTLIDKFKMLFYEDVASHYRDGINRLYPAIAKRRRSCTLGWLNSRGIEKKCCRHVETSESYRCMRTNVMRMAGPTASKLAMYRNKMENVLVPSFVRDIIAGHRRCAAILMSRSCGNDVLR